jgi:hypothetical protein
LLILRHVSVTGPVLSVYKRAASQALASDNCRVSAFHINSPFQSIKKAACCRLSPVVEEFSPIRVFPVKNFFLLFCQLPRVIFKKVEQIFAVERKHKNANGIVCVV